MSAKHYIEFDGFAGSQAEWAARLGISKQAMSLRLLRYPVEIACNMKRQQRAVDAGTDYVAGTPKVDGLAEIIIERKSEIVEGLFSGSEKARLATVKLRREGIYF